MDDPPPPPPPPHGQNPRPPGGGLPQGNYDIVIIPPQVWIDLMYNHGYAKGFASFVAEDYFRFGSLEGIIMPTWQHLWFVVYLFAYTLAVVVLYALLPASWRARIADGVGRLLGSPWSLMLLPVVWIVLRHAVFFPGVSDTHALVDDMAAHYIFFTAFLFGFLLRHSPAIWTSIRRGWRIAAAIALVTTVAMIAQVWWLTGTEWSSAAEAVYTIVRAAQSWCVIVALLGVADRYWNHDATMGPMLNEAVFPFYIIHQTVIVVFIWYLRPLALPTAFAFILTVAATALGCWLFYRIGRAIPVLRVLIGLKGWRIPPSPAGKDAAIMPA